jgi:hypothetical protein
LKTEMVKLRVASGSRIVVSIIYKAHQGKAMGVQLNCWRHELLHCWVLKGERHPGASCGGANLRAPVGLAANGTPKNLLTVAVAPGFEVVVPMITPESIVTIGLQITKPARNVLSMVSIRRKSIMTQMKMEENSIGQRGSV